MIKNLLSLISLVFFISCNNSYQEILQEAEDTVMDNPDEALVKLSVIVDPDKLDDSLRARYWLQVGQAHYNREEAMANLHPLQNSLEFYKIQGSDTNRIVQSLFLTAQYFLWNKDDIKAEKLLQEGLQITLENHDTLSSLFIYKSLNEISEKRIDIESSLYYTQQMMKMDTIPIHFPEYCINLGNLYAFLNNEDSTVYFYEKAIKFSTHINDVNKAFFAKRMYADALNDLGRIKKALKLQIEVLDYYTKKNDKRASISNLSLSNYYMNINMIDSASYYIGNVDENWIKNEIALNTYYIIQKEIIKYVSQSSLDMRSIILLINKMFNKSLDKEKELTEQLQSKNLLERKNIEIYISKQRTQFLLIVILLIFIIAIGLGYFYLYARKKELLEKEEQVDTLKDLLSKAERAKKTNNDFFYHILLQQLGIIKLVAAEPTSENKRLLKQIVQITNKDISVETLLIWNDLYVVVDSIYNNFYSNLISKYFNILSEKEIQLCCLLKAEFSTKEISVVIQQSTQTIYQRKTTIRQKLKMASEADIIDFIENINSTGIS